MKRLLLLSAFAVGILPLTPGHAIAAEGLAKPVLTVTVAHPVTAKIAASISANGSITAWQEASIGAEVGGYGWQRSRSTLVTKSNAVKC